MAMMMWGPGLDYEIEYRRERLSHLWGRPSWTIRRERTDRRRGAARIRRRARATQPGPALRRSQVWHTAR